MCGVLEVAVNGFYTWRETFQSRAHVRERTIESISTLYNRNRRYSTLHSMSHVMYAEAVNYLTENEVIDASIQ
jgi:hypothetical protein